MMAFFVEAIHGRNTLRKGQAHPCKIGPAKKRGACHGMPLFTF